MRIHISLPVKDLEKSVAFYSTVLANPASKLKDDYANFRLDEPAIHLALVAKKDSSSVVSASHFGVELPDHNSLETWRERATAEDLDLLDDPDASCCYARADKFWLSDPDGNRWEFWVRTGESEVLQQQSAACC
jgi:catechol 2,3-dioxygenase-like lactoylglutathione lyase family enzyme